MKTILIATLFLPLAACVVEEDPELETEEAAINGASHPAVSWMIDNAVDMPNCTGTLIEERFVLTALHCVDNLPVGTTFRFYENDGDHYSDPTFTATVDRWFIPPGTWEDGDTDDWVDANGNHADIAIARLETRQRGGATLAWTYPGDGKTGFKVGAGNHDSTQNANGELLYVTDTTWSDDDADKDFHTEHHRTDKGDSGGPFYYNGRVLGTLTGSYLLGTFRGYHTSVPGHLPWILSSIGWEWPGDPPVQGVYQRGTVKEAFFAVERVCQYACEKTSSCEAYNFTTAGGLPYCQLVRDLTTPSSSSVWRSGLK